jgi:hypothetical protein
MNTNIQVISIIGSIVITLIVAELIRRRKLREEYSLLWFAASLLLMVIAFGRHLMERAATLLGIAYPPSLLLLGAILMGFLLSLHFSISLTRLAEQNKRLAQELALMNQKLGSLERSAQVSSGSH